VLKVTLNTITIKSLNKRTTYDVVNLILLDDTQTDGGVKPVGLIPAPLLLIVSSATALKKTTLMYTITKMNGKI
jgi:hypothetical protein